MPSVATLTGNEDANSRFKAAWETVRPQTVLWSNSGLASLGSKEQDFVSLQCRLRAFIFPKTASHWQASFCTTDEEFIKIGSFRHQQLFDLFTGRCFEC